MRFILITLALGIVSAAMNHTALAKKEVKLIGVEEGINHDHLTSDIIGDTVIIGSRGAGTATIYLNDGKDWKKQEDLLAHDHNARDPYVPGYAYSVAIGAPHEFATPNFAIIGAPRHLHGGDNLKGLQGPAGFGAAYIFRRSGKTWKEHIRLVAPDPVDDDRYGESVAIYRTTAVVGASKDDDNGKNSGSVFVYVLDGTTWKTQTKIVPEDLVGSDAFGETVSLDENTLAVGAPGHTHGGVRFAGAVYIFVREGINGNNKPNSLPMIPERPQSSAVLYHSPSIRLSLEPHCTTPSAEEMPARLTSSYATGTNGSSRQD